MICNRCGAQFNSPFCPNCGAPAPSQPQINQPQQTPPPVPPNMIYQQNSLIQKHQVQNKKKRGCLFWGVLIFSALFLLLIISAMISACVSVSTDNATEATNNVSDEAMGLLTVTPEPTEKPIEYTAYDVTEMMNDLNSNALKAEKKYQDQYVEITGRLSNIDSDGKYINLVPADDEYAFMGVQCYIKSDEQTENVLEMTIDDTVTVKGQITSIGEVLGYSLDIGEIK